MIKMKDPSAYFLFGFLSILLSIGARAEDTRPAFLQQDLSAVVADLRAIVPSLIKDARIPGLQIALIRDGKIAWHDNFGLKNASTGEPVADDTVFEAASLTKPFFAYYVMKEVDRGVLSLDKPLAGYISADVAEKFLGHPLAEKGFHRDWFEKITARQVLSHRSGMPHLEQGTPYPLLFEPGSKWKYSAGGYFFLQKVIETLKGDKLENLMRKEVLDPLGMTRSGLIWRDEYERTMANGHDFFGQPNEFRKRTEAHAAASLYTTAEDYAKFVCAVLNGEGLRPETLKEMLAIQSEIDKGNEKFNGAGWSLGFGTQTDAHGFAIWQWGDFDIFRNYIMAYTKEKTAVVYLTNSFYGLGICPEVIAHSVGGQALVISQEYWHYDHPLYRIGGEMMEKGPTIAGQLPELAKKFPDAFSQDSIDFLTYFFREPDKLPTILAVLKFQVKEHPRSGRATFNLAKTLVRAGDRLQARVYLMMAGRAKEDKVEPAAVDWNLKFVQTLIKPENLRKSHMRRLAGAYGDRNLEFRNGRLYYFRKGVADAKPLFAMSKDTFVLESLPNFRLKIEFDENGNPVKAVGLYDDGSRDETARDK